MHFVPLKIALAISQAVRHQAKLEDRDWLDEVIIRQARSRLIHTDCESLSGYQW